MSISQQFGASSQVLWKCRKKKFHSKKNPKYSTATPLLLGAPPPPVCTLIRVNTANTRAQLAKRDEKFLTGSTAHRLCSCQCFSFFCLFVMGFEIALRSRPSSFIVIIRLLGNNASNFNAESKIRFWWGPDWNVNKNKRACGRGKVRNLDLFDLYHSVLFLQTVS